MPEPAPFEIDTWPRCEPWQRLGQVTVWDTLQIEEWGEWAQLQIELEIDRRMDAILTHVHATAWPGVE